MQDSRLDPIRREGGGVDERTDGESMKREGRGSIGRCYTLSASSLNEIWRFVLNFKEFFGF